MFNYRLAQQANNPEAPTRKRSASAMEARQELYKRAPELLAAADSLADNPRWKSTSVYETLLEATEVGQKKERLRSKAMLEAVAAARGQSQRDLAERLYNGGAPLAALQFLPRRFATDGDLTDDERIENMLVEMRKGWRNKS